MQTLEARDKLIEENIKLARFVASKYPRTEDAFGIALYALVRAAGGYKPEKGYAFSTYAVPIAHRAIVYELRRKRIRCISLDEPLEAARYLTVADTLADSKPLPCEIAERREMLAVGLSAISHKEKALLKEIYLYDKAYIQIATERGVSRAHIWAWHKRIIAKMRKAITEAYPAT